MRLALGAVTAWCRILRVVYDRGRSIRQWLACSGMESSSIQGFMPPPRDDARETSSVADESFVSGLTDFEARSEDDSRSHFSEAYLRREKMHINCEHPHPFHTPNHASLVAPQTASACSTSLARRRLAVTIHPALTA